MHDHPLLIADITVIVATVSLEQISLERFSFYVLPHQEDEAHERGAEVKKATCGREAKEKGESERRVHRGIDA